MAELSWIWDGAQHTIRRRSEDRCLSEWVAIPEQAVLVGNPRGDAAPCPSTAAGVGRGSMLTEGNKAVVCDLSSVEGRGKAD